MNMSIVAIVMMGAMLLVVVQAGQECVDDDGSVHIDGESFIGADGCNECACKDGNIRCTRMACPEKSGCEVNGVKYNPGDSYIAEDGCNNCFCSENGVGACTLMACGE